MPLTCRLLTTVAYALNNNREEMNALTYIHGNPGAIEPVASSSFLQFGTSLGPGRNSDFIWVFWAF
jgi:hypothetical protein